MRTAPAVHGSPAAAFTLAETMVAIVATSILGGALMTLILGQHRFYAGSDGTITARQNARAAADLLSGELRAASPGDLLSAGPDELSLRFDVVRGLVCEPGPGGSAFVFVHDSVSTANLPGGVTGAAVSGPYDSTFVYADGWTGAVWPRDAKAEARCKALGAPAGAPRSAFRAVGGWVGPFPGTPARGSIARWYGTLTYRLSASSSHPGALSLRRNGQELVTPFEAGSRFEYLMVDGSVLGAVPPAMLDRIREVRIRMTVTGEGSIAIRRPLVLDIPLRD